MKSTHTLSNWLFFAWFVAAFGVLFATGCQEEAPPTERQLLIEVDPAIVEAKPIYNDAGLLIPPDEMPAENYARILVSAGDTEIETYPNSTVELAVLLLNGNGDPISQERVDFKITNEDFGDAALTASRTRTDDFGYARMSLYAGTSLRTLTIEAKNATSRTITFKVSVVDMPVGNITANFDYEGPIDLGSFEFYILDDPNACEDPYYLSVPEDVLQTKTFESIYENIESDPILAGKRVSLMVRGRLASNGVLAAGGCLGDIKVDADINRRVTVPIFLLTLSPSGNFDVINHFNFTGAIPGTIGAVIDNLVMFFGSEGQDRQVATVIINAVAALVRNFVSGLAGEIIQLVGDWIDDPLNRLINTYLEQDAPHWMRVFFQAGSDITSVVSYLEIISKVRIAKPASNGTFQGSQNWIGLALYWRTPCLDNPDRDPESCRHEFTMDEIWALLNDAQMVYGQFSGRIHSYNQGIIDSHSVALQYGKLIVFVMNHLILPSIAGGSTSLSQALLYWINCGAFARRITGDDGYLINIHVGPIDWDAIEANTIESWCSTIFGAVGAVIQAILNRLNIDTHLTLQGTMTFIEEDNDLAVDRLGEGIWTGTIRADGDTGPAFKGDFDGQNFNK